MEPTNGNGKPHIPGRQRGRIPAEEWAEIQAHRRSLAKQLADVEAAIKLEEEIAKGNGPDRSPCICGYIRCSHQDSKDSGLGEEGQKRIIERWAALIMETYHIKGPIRWFHEPAAVSAFKKRLIFRNKGGDMNQFLHGGDHVIFAYLDRAFRNTEDCLGTLRVWKTRGITVHFANLHVDMNTPMGPFLVAVLAAGAQMESAMKSERIKEVFAGFPALGRVRNGHAPIGYKLTGKKGMHRAVVPDIAQRLIMAEVARFRESWIPNPSWERVADYVNKWCNKQDIQAGKNPLQWKRITEYRCRELYKAELKLREKRNQKEKPA